MERKRYVGRLTNEDYARIFDRTTGLGIVRAAWDLLILDEDKRVALVQRDIPPELGTWHLPGGKINGGESFQEFASRVAKHDLGIGVEFVDAVGGLNFPAEVSTMEVEGEERELTIHTVSTILLCKPLSAGLRGSAEGKNVGWFATAPKPAHSVHIPWLLKHGYLQA
ncbi:MAG TPA: NUDIX domain-containing protein [Candidatus Paceibacterota bacterium]|nr:NUDIX domain-containing protein [Candidatus Paceibacterota bacterium]